jgi:hypothetical protein
MLGKISTGMRSSDKTPNIAMAIATTINVCGLRRANSTIHIRPDVPRAARLIRAEQAEFDLIIT